MLTTAGKRPQASSKATAQHAAPAQGYRGAFAARVLQMQRAVGNRAVVQMMRQSQAPMQFALDPVETTRMKTDYEVPYFGKEVKQSDITKATLFGRTADLKPLVNKDPAKLNKLAGALNAVGDDAARQTNYVDSLLIYNRLFGYAEVTYKRSPNVDDDLAVLQLIDPELTADATLRAGVKNYVDKSSHLGKLREAINGDVTMLPAIAEIMKTPGGNHSTISPQTMPKLKEALLKHPPGSVFAGMIWGPGSKTGGLTPADDIETNKVEHFEKHCLGLHGAPDPTEPFKWMQALAVEITAADYRKWKGSDWDTDKPDLFDASATKITTADQAVYVFQNVVQTDGAVQAELKGRWMSGYLNLVQTGSQHLTGTIIQSAGSDVMIMGNYSVNGVDVFICGKMHTDTFSISSGYVPTDDKLAKQTTTTAWRL